MTTDAVTDHPADELDDIDRELLNALQWDFPVVAQPYAALGERLGISEAEVLARTRRVKDVGRPAPALGDLRHPRARLLLRARRGRDRPRPHRRGRGDHQPPPRREPQLQAQPLVQPLVHAGRAAGRGLRRPPRRAAPRVRLARHPQAADAEALQDRREARHDRQHRGEREGRGARAREARAARDHGRARAERLGHRGHLHRAGGPAARRASVRGAGREDRRHRGASCSRRCSRSRTAS